MKEGENKKEEKEKKGQKKENKEKGKEMNEEENEDKRREENLLTSQIPGFFLNYLACLHCLVHSVIETVYRVNAEAWVHQITHF